MDINSAYSLFETQSTSPVAAENKKQTSQKVDSASGDTVSISDEAKAMLAQMTRPLTGGEESSSDTSQNKDAGDGKSGGSGGAGGAGASGGAASGEDTIEDLQSQISKLQAQYQGVMQGSAPEGVKEAQGAGLQQQITALEQQLNQLKTASLKKG